MATPAPGAGGLQSQLLDQISASSNARRSDTKTPRRSERACCFPGASFPPGPRPPTCPPPGTQVPTEAPEPRPLAPTPPASAGPGTPRLRASPLETGRWKPTWSPTHILFPKPPLCLKGTCRCLDGRAETPPAAGLTQEPIGGPVLRTQSCSILRLKLGPLLAISSRNLGSDTAHLSGDSLWAAVATSHTSQTAGNQSWMHLRSESQASGSDLQYPPPPDTHTPINR